MDKAKPDPDGPDHFPAPYRWLRFRTSRIWSEHLSFIMQIGLTMVGCIVFCFFTGRYLDRLFGLRGIFVSALTVFGVIGGAYITYRQILEMTERDKRLCSSSDTEP
ncbi:MAG: AtpZ/AtpI family protein [Thermodesulfobacteriota bacterium]